MADPNFVHPELVEILANLDRPSGMLTEEGVPAARARSRVLSQKWLTPGSVMPTKHILTRDSGDLDVWYFQSQQNGADAPCMVWFHGGGFVMGQGRDIWFGQLFSEFASCNVLSVEYRLAPEHRAPAAVEDGLAALEWLHENADFLGVDRNKILIGGASAGAGVAAGLALMNRDRGGPSVAMQLLLYPMLDRRHLSASHLTKDYPIWWREQSLSCWSMYLGDDPNDSVIQYAAAAEAVDLSGLPPARSFVGTTDLFHDEVEAYHRRLIEHGVDSQFRSYGGMFHCGEVVGSQTSIGIQMCQDYVDVVARQVGAQPKRLSTAHFT